jgi:hypothetical protein
MVKKKESKKEWEIEVPPHLLEPHKIALEKVPGKTGFYRVAADCPACGDCICEGPCQVCWAHPIAYTEALKEDLIKLSKQVNNLVKNMDNRFSQLEQILTSLKKPK